MCIIVDANRFGRFLTEADPDAKPVRDWLKKGGLLVYSTSGCKFKKEVTGNARIQLRRYWESGQAKQIEASEFKEDECRLKESAIVKSDDAHILALARKSGARLLYSDDAKLIMDFKNKNIINKPRGKVYSRASNADLLARTKCRPPGGAKQ